MGSECRLGGTPRQHISGLQSPAAFLLIYTHHMKCFLCRSKAMGGGFRSAQKSFACEEYMYFWWQGSQLGILFQFHHFSLMKWWLLRWWWYGKRIILLINNRHNKNFKLNLFDDYITYVILSIIIGGRLGYVLFYNFNYFIR